VPPCLPHEGKDILPILELSESNPRQHVRKQKVLPNIHTSPIANGGAMILSVVILNL
jgi:hypothetical protein